MAVSSCIARKKGTEISTAGLRIIILQLSEVEECCNNSIVVKSGLKSLSSNIDGVSSNCYLKSCHLCKKPLCPHKDVYMYRGDQGFCSVECRSRQIMVDERREMDANIKNRLRPPPSIECHGCETCKLLEDLRQRRNHRNNNNKLKPFISPTQHHHQPLLSFS